MDPVTLAAFADELEKIGASVGLSHVNKARKGVRPISVDKLVAKHNEGTWQKKADSMGSPQDVRGDSVDDPGAAKPPKRTGEVPTKDPGNIPVSEKTGYYKLDDTTIPLSWGEDMRAQTTVQKKPGDVPTQSNNAVDQPDLRSPEPMGRMKPALVNDVSAKKVRKGDVPTRDNDTTKVDRFDGRDNATTVTGLAQNSTNIGAFNSPGEHT